MCKKLFFRGILSEKCLFPITSVIQSHPQGQIYVLAYKLEIGARILPCVGFYFD